MTDDCKDRELPNLATFYYVILSGANACSQIYPGVANSFSYFVDGMWISVAS